QLERLLFRGCGQADGLRILGLRQTDLELIETRYDFRARAGAPQITSQTSFACSARALRFDALDHDEPIGHGGAVALALGGLDGAGVRIRDAYVSARDYRPRPNPR